MFSLDFDQSNRFLILLSQFVRRFCCVITMDVATGCILYSSVLSKFRAEVHIIRHYLLCKWTANKHLKETK